MQARCHVPDHDRRETPPRNRELPGMKKPAEILAAIALSLSLGVVHADVVEYDIYMTDSNAGRTVFERRDGEVSGNQQLAFNNRRSNIDMTFVLGENQVPSRMAFKGTSP